MERIDLHTHTLASDGSDAPAAVVQQAAALGLRAVAVTDHDTFAGLPEALAAGQRCGIEVVPGVELSTVWGGEEVHLLGYFMDTEDLLKFTLLTTVDDAIGVMAKVRHRYFPILDEEGKYCGMLSRRNILSLQKRRIILVDHNESTQAVEGFEQSEILEIIDHHRIGSLETAGPVYFRNQPVGSTCTIIAQMYQEAAVDIPVPIAGLMLSAILSDTLKFSSPTCTPLDRRVAETLAQIAGVDIDRYAGEMFEAGERLDGKSAEDVFMQDFKIFMCGDARFGVAQGNFLTRSNLDAARKLLEDYLPEALVRQNVEYVYVLLTVIQASESVAICCGTHAARILQDAFDAAPAADGTTLLPGVVSRKKQFIPKVMDAYQQL